MLFLSTPTLRVFGAPAILTLLDGFPAEGRLHVAQVVLLALFQGTVFDAQGIRIEGVRAPGVEFTVAVVAGDAVGH